ncbi:Myc-type, basic helix-loop-helix (bHLH) domain [Dillenia turbinata]|uniref:Myc-type, basic helix-loop-helix (BHLH) domain n=1 Tax=Dillenia turbinata TaxID=194707 RepID=A0AAN8VL52_9MAGN
MEKEENFSAALPANFTSLDYALDDQHNSHQPMKSRIGGDSDVQNDGMVDYMLNTKQHQMPPRFCTSSSLEHRLSFTDVMQFADFGPKFALNQAKINEEETGIDPVYFLKFPVLNEKLQDESSLLVPQHVGDSSEERFKGVAIEERTIMIDEEKERENEEEVGASENTSVQNRFLGENIQEVAPMVELAKSKRKRPRTIKTSEEVESQRMTHMAVERNRRKQMNEHLQVLRSLVPGSYVQRGDQASIIGGAIEFVRELEQLIQCLESQKRRRLYGEGPQQVGDPSLALQQPPPLPPFFPPLPSEQIDYETAGLCEEMAENKSCLAEVEVKRLGLDAMIKILSRKRPGQLIKTIAALEDLKLSILHTNITTTEQTVLYSFNVKVGSESRFTAEDIASSKFGGVEAKRAHKPNTNPGRM